MTCKQQGPGLAGQSNPPHLSRPSMAAQAGPFSILIGGGWILHITMSAAEVTQRSNNYSRITVVLVSQVSTQPVSSTPLESLVMIRSFWLLLAYRGKSHSPL